MLFEKFDELRITSFMLMDSMILYHKGILKYKNLHVSVLENKQM